MIQDDEEEEAAAGWIVSFADLMTLLFAVFVVLYGIKPEGESQEILGVTSSIREAFVDIPDTIPDEHRKGPIKTGKAVFKYFKGDQVRPPNIKIYRRNEYSINVINRDFQEAKNMIGLLSDRKVRSLRDRSQKGEVVSAHKDKDGFRLRLVGSYFYEPGSFRVKRDARKRLKIVGEYLKTLKRNFTIEGYTDNIPPTGDMTNLQLSSLRAAYVARFFKAQLGIDTKYMSIAGYGDNKPMADNATKKGRDLNRRIEIKINYYE